MRALKGLEDHIQLIEVDGMEEGKGWVFTGKTGPSEDPLYGFKYLRELYMNADAQYKGRITVPVLWDKKKGDATLFIVFHIQMLSKLQKPLLTMKAAKSFVCYTVHLTNICL